MTRQVYRVQNYNGQGYTAAGGRWRNYAVSPILADGSERNPNPDADHDTPLHTRLSKSYDGERFQISNYIFGFKDLQDLQLWFTRSELRCLAKHGYYIFRCLIRGVDVHDGTRQLIFARDELLAQERISIFRIPS